MEGTIYSEGEHAVHVIVDRDTTIRKSKQGPSSNSGSATTINVLRLWLATR
ncbi:hypothetical protein [Paraburkholderia sp.]|uniref:hypothetical protein n=1 Tax=Paraburkholderia sp. TaxID=1926495 RepID=UPI002D42A2AF|nr:hypothetical protein [Paraburkholderia sp.]HZZ01891.1 hypothetical protein [Paraburkholderia sp.]